MWILLSLLMVVVCARGTGAWAWDKFNQNWLVTLLFAAFGVLACPVLVAGWILLRLARSVSLVYKV